MLYCIYVLRHISRLRTCCRSFEVFGRFENSHGRFEFIGRFEVSKTGHFATGHFTHHAKSDTSHFRWREIGHFEHTFEIGHFEHGARHSQRVSGAVDARAVQWRSSQRAAESRGRRLGSSASGTTNSRQVCSIAAAVDRPAVASATVEAAGLAAGG